MKNILFIIFCVTVVKIWTVALEKYGPRSRLNLDYIEMPAYVKKMPGRYNYCARILSSAQMNDILSTGLIRTVIYFGSDTSRVVSTREVCAAYDVELFCVFPGEINAKSDIKGRLIQGQNLMLLPLKNLQNEF